MLVATTGVLGSLRVWVGEECEVRWIRKRNGSRLKRKRKPYSTLCRSCQSHRSCSTKHALLVPNLWRRKSWGSPLVPTNSATFGEEVDSHNGAVVLVDGEVLWKGGDLEMWRRCWVTIGVRRKSRQNHVETLRSLAATHCRKGEVSWKRLGVSFNGNVEVLASRAWARLSERIL